MNAMPAARVLILGLGNPDRGDDGFGPQVVKLLEGRLPPDVAATALGTDIMMLVPEWAKYAAVICIDAATLETRPGTVHRFDLAERDLPRRRLPPSSHGFGLIEAVELSRVLGEQPGAIIVFAVEGLCFDAGAAMTPQVTAALEDVAGRVAAEIEALRQRI